MSEDLRLIDALEVIPLVREKVKQEDNKSEAADMLGMPYYRFLNIGNDKAPRIRADDLLKVMRRYGFKVAVTPPPVPPPFPPEGWKEHPTAPGWYYKGQDVKTKAQLKAMVVAAAELALAAAAAE